MTTAGIPIVISAPSGTGKTSLCLNLLESDPRVVRSVSYTTRPARDGDVDGVDYHFVSLERFDQMIEDEEFVEWAEVFGNKYGTGIQAIRQQISYGRDVLLDIDVQGGAQIRQHFDGALLIFILPPSMTELRRRLEKRGTDEPEVIERRLADARKEIRVGQDYAYLLVNEDLEETTRRLGTIIATHRMHQERHSDTVRRLLSE